MLITDHDEYAERHKVGPGFLFWAVWVAATIGGAVVGATARDAVQRAVHLSSAFDIVQTALMGAALGAGLGLAQGVALVRYLKLRGIVEWTIATILGGSLSAMVISTSVDALAGVAFDYSMFGITAYWIAYALIGAMGGAMLGFAQSLVLQQRVVNAGWWALANAGATALYTLFVAFFTLHDSTADINGALVSGVLRGLITGIALVELLRHPTAGAGWTFRMKPEKPVRASLDPGTQPSPEALLEEMRAKGD